MNKPKALFGGCLTGVVGLVLFVVGASLISSYLYDAPFRYRVRKYTASPNGKAYAHYFIKNSMQDSRGKYAGISISRNKTLSRDYENEVFVVSPHDALIYVEFEWHDNLTLEIKYQVDPSSKTYIHYGRTPPSLLRDIIFTELPTKTHVGGES